MVRRLGLGEKQPSDLRQSCAQPSKCKYIPRKLYKGREQVCKNVSVFCPLICKFSMFLFGDRFSLVNTVHVKYKCPKICT